MLSYILKYQLGNALSWLKINLFYIGMSKKKHRIFRAKKWNKGLEKIFKKQVFSEAYENVGQIKDIFGPAQLPFISIKSTETFAANNVFYVKV